VNRRDFLLGTMAGLMACGAKSVAQGPSRGRAEANEKAIERLARRRLGSWADHFRFAPMSSEDGLDVFEIESAGSQILICANSPVAHARALNCYLREYCHAQISWTGDQLHLPADPPRVPAKVHRTSPYPYRYYLNYCTFGYTMAYWDWERWQHQLDWMALSGINLSLAAVIGQETVWRNVLRRMHLPEDEIRAFLPGMCYAPWMLMGDMQQWGGPVAEHVLEQRLVLQQNILARMRDLGIEPVLQAFYGMVPTSLKTHYPDANIISTGDWNNFVRPDMLVPGDPLFTRMASIWYEEQARLFGNARFFAGDPFHEGTVQNIDLQEAGYAIHSAMRVASPGAVWVMQAWQGNPSEKLLEGTVKEATLILDLFGESQPEYKERDGFHGHPWVWCIVSNFGGKVGLYGQFDKIAEGPIQARRSGRMSGVGAMMEGIITDYPTYELLFDMGWQTSAPNLTEWARNYALQRYGAPSRNAEDAWILLRNSVYAVNAKQQGEPESIFCARPSATIHSASSWGTISRDYNPRDLQMARDLLMREADRFGHISTYRFDITDITRQVLANLGLWQFRQMTQALNARHAAGFARQSGLFLAMILDQDRLLATQQAFLLGKWIADARAWGNSPPEKDQLEKNARTLLTLWGPKAAAETLHDYANREWSGLLGDFYYGRWQLWIDRQRKVLQGEIPKPIDWYDWEAAWAEQRNSFPAAPAGDPVIESRRIGNKYTSLLRLSVQ
jgi:alpha-N-acetylglucosaminidase